MLVLVLNIAIVVSFSLTGCTKEDKQASEVEEVEEVEEQVSEAQVEETEDAEKKLVIGYVTKSASNQGWILINNGAKQAAIDEDVEFLVGNPLREEDIVEQIVVTEDLINRNPDALAIATVDSWAIGPAVIKANDAGIPVVAMDDEILEGEVVSFVGTDNYEAARLAGEWIGAELNGQGNVALINGNTAVTCGYDRRQGVIDVFEEKYPDIEVIFEGATNWDTETALKNTEDALTANSDIDVIYCAWDGGTIGALAAVEAAGRLDEIKLVGFDCAPDVLQAMREGKVAADVAQFLFQIGYQGIMTAIQAARGEDISDRVDTGSMMVTPENLEEFITDNDYTQFME